MSTLDHLTEGRIGWNVVTGYLDSAARRRRQGEADRAMTTATMSPTNIWRWSTSSGKEAGRTTPHGAIVSVGYLPIPPRCIASSTRETITGSTPFTSANRPPQRTPVLYQAGTSPRGRQFAAEHAECVFMSGPSAEEIIAPRVAAIRELATKAGRNPARDPDVQHVHHHSRANRKRKHPPNTPTISVTSAPRGALTLMSGWTGVDFSTLRPRPRGVPRPERRRPHRDGQHHPRRSGQGLDRTRGRRACRHRRHRAGRGRHAGKGRRRRSKRGSILTDVDGLNVPFAISPGRFRGYHQHAGAGTGAGGGRYKDAYQTGTLREKTVRQGTRAAGSTASCRAVSPAYDGEKRRSRLTGVGWAKAFLRRAHHLSACGNLSRMRCALGGHAALCPPYDLLRQCSNCPVHHHFDQLRAGPFEGRCQARASNPLTQ